MASTVIAGDTPNNERSTGATEDRRRALEAIATAAAELVEASQAWLVTSGNPPTLLATAGRDPTQDVDRAMPVAMQAISTRSAAMIFEEGKPGFKYAEPVLSTDGALLGALVLADNNARPPSPSKCAKVAALAFATGQIFEARKMLRGAKALEEARDDARAELKLILDNVPM